MTRIAIFTDEPVLGVGLSAVLSTGSDLQFAGVWSDPASLTYFVSREKPDVLLLDLERDISLPMISDILHTAPECKLVCWVRSIPIDVALRLLDLGVAGVQSKHASGDAIAATLLRIAGGEKCVDESVFAPSPQSHRLKLTGRESQILSLVALGMRNREMASALSISEGTLKVYVSRLLHKTGLRDRRQLALFRLKNPDVASEAGRGDGDGKPAIPRRGDRATAWWQPLRLNRLTG